MWLSDFQLVLPDRVLDRGSIRIEGAEIAEIVDGPAPSSTEARIDGQGLTIIPGIIDLHGDMIEHVVEPRPRASFPYELAVYELDKQLAAAGLTDAFAAVAFAWSVIWRDQANRRDEERIRGIFSAIRQLRSKLLIGHHVHARFDVSAPEATLLLNDLIQNGLVGMLSIMDHSPGQGQYRDIDRLIDDTVKNRGMTREAVETAVRRKLEEMQARDDRWSDARILARSAQTQGLAVASHDDDTSEKLGKMVDLGVTIAEFPVTFEAAEDAHRRGLSVIMGAPNVLRGRSHTGNLSAKDAIRAGLVDALAADYYPPALLQAAYNLAFEKVCSLPESIALISSGPARAAGWTDRGRLEAGWLADLALVEESKIPRVRGTLKEGKLVFADSSVHDRLTSMVIS